MVEKMKHAISWFIRGKDGQVHLIQIPNIILIGWFIFMIVSNFTAEGPIKTGLSNLSLVFLAVWSCLEILRGASPFRRTLGLVIAILIIYSFFR